VSELADILLGTGVVVTLGKCLFQTLKEEGFLCVCVVGGGGEGIKYNKHVQWKTCLQNISIFIVSKRAIYIYIYIRERERERKCMLPGAHNATYVYTLCTCTCTCTCSLVTINIVVVAT
jgi:hypothetical protein